MDKGNSKEGNGKRCTYCRAIEDKVRMVGNFVVELTEINVNGTTKFVCQSCKVKVREAREAVSKNLGF